MAADRAVNTLGILFNRRFFYILSTIWDLVSFGLWQSKAKEDPAQGKAIACRIRKSFIALGVTFIKLGQFLSMRPDILPVELTDELSLLQDQVPPFSFAQVKAIAERELGQSLNEVFDTFETEPIASASIGQVHKAYLQDGTAVAVKVQRPGLAKIIYQDLGFMRLIARLGTAWHWHGDWQAWLELVDDFGHNLFAEMDYLQEGRHADRLRKILRPMPSIIIPRIIWRQTTKQVLTEELCQGIKIDNGKALAKQQIDIRRLCTQILDAYLLQIFIHGYFHADPHAGNFAVTPAGQLIIYDFGMVSYITSGQRQGLINAITSVVNNDGQSFIAALEELGIVSQLSEENKESLEKTIQPFLSFCQASSAAEINLSELEREMDQLVKKQSLKLPANLAYLLRTAAALEGFVRMLSPEFNFVRAAKPYFKPIVIKRMQLVGAKLSSSPSNFNNN